MLFMKYKVNFLFISMLGMNFLMFIEIYLLGEIEKLYMLISIYIFGMKFIQYCITYLFN